MRRKFAILITPLVALTLLSFSHSSSYADVGEVPEEGGVITPGDKTDKIEMKKEKVVFEIKKHDINSPFYDAEVDNLDYIQNYAHVTADFEMLNTSSGVVSMNLMFPAPEMFYGMNHYDPSNISNQSLNFQVKVDGITVEQKFETLTMESFKENPAFEEDVLAITFTVDFPANSTTNITVEYDNRLVNEAKSIYGSFNYIMETGSHWKGNIGTGEIIFKFPSAITQAMFLEYNDFFKIDRDMLVWEFESLEPDSINNIKVTYNPDLLENWSQKESYLFEVESSVDTKLESSNIPETEEYKDVKMLGWKYNIEGNPIYLTKSVEEEVTDGWLTEFDKTNKPWVKFDLDGTYKVYAASILSGISSKNYSDEKNSDKFYTLLSRPKVITLSFSDGSSETINLNDTPTEIQKEAFNEVETSFVKVTVDEVYSGKTLDKDILGIGRMSFEVGDKVAEVEDTEETNTAVTPTDQAKDQTLLERLTVGDLRTVTIVVLSVLGIALFTALGVIGTMRLKKQSDAGGVKKESIPEQESELGSEPAGEE
ncbi:MAG: DUF4424 family protein [Patescibacteria group bacterium]|nr:DUF4424 domain-containing protein [Patescibacteria group bacterium]